MTVPSRRETWGELGEAMRALPNARWRDFVFHYLTGPKPFNGAAAYRAAGFQTKDTLNDARNAHQLLQDDRMQAALTEEARKYYRGTVPAAVAAVREIIADPGHKDRARVAQALLDRVDPLITRHDMNVVHKVQLSADDEALEEYLAAKHLGADRAKLLELFGGNYLPKLERLAAQRATQAKVIEGQVLDPIEELIGPVEEVKSDDAPARARPETDNRFKEIFEMEDGSF